MRIGLICMWIATLLTAKPLLAQESDVIKMTVWPQPASQLDLPCRLLPDETEMRDGNAAPVILRMVYEQRAFMQNWLPQINEIAELEHDHPRVKEFPFAAFHRQLKRAASIRDADWEYPLDSDRPWEILLPDAQSMRQFIGRGMKIWINQQIADQALEQARDGVKIQLACARHVGRTPVLVNQLIASAIAQVSMERLEVIASQPNSENLYWSLSLLPRWLVDVHAAMQWESGTLRQGLTALGDVDPSIGSPRWKAAAEQFLAMMEVMVTERYSPDEAKQLAAKVTAFAEQKLREANAFSDQEMAKMSDEEKVLRWTLKTQKSLHDRMEMAFHLPGPLALKRLAAVESDIQKIQEESGVPGHPFLGGSARLYASLSRFNRMVKLLQTFEGIRDYAQQHAGNLPESLDDLRLKAPHDPMTDQPFEYQKNGKVAMVQWKPLPGDLGVPIRQYEITASGW